MRTILVDDEENALSILEIKLKKYFPGIDIIEKYNNPLMAIEGINQHKPDLLFLDVKMPTYNGFELLDHILSPKFELIFVTAYGEYALEAIKQCAIGYILKPIDDNELKSAVVNAMNNWEAKRKQSAPQSLGKVTIPFANGYVIKDVKEIIRCEGFGGYTKIYLTSGEIITSSYSIGLFNNMLSDDGFVMVHKSHLVNLHSISVYYNDGIIELSNKDRIPVSKLNRPLLLSLFKG